MIVRSCKAVEPLTHDLYRKPSEYHACNAVYSSSCTGGDAVSVSSFSDPAEVSVELGSVVDDVVDDEGLTAFGALGAFLLINRRT